MAEKNLAVSVSISELVTDCLKCPCCGVPSNQFERMLYVIAEAEKKNCQKPV